MTETKVQCKVSRKYIDRGTSSVPVYGLLLPSCRTCSNSVRLQCGIILLAKKVRQPLQTKRKVFDVIQSVPDEGAHEGPEMLDTKFHIPLAKARLRLIACPENKDISTTLHLCKEQFLFRVN